MNTEATENSIIKVLKTNCPDITESILCEIILGRIKFKPLLTNAKEIIATIIPVYGFRRLKMPDCPLPLGEPLLFDFSIMRYTNIFFRIAKERQKQ
jgi:hypothetical protein